MPIFLQRDRRGKLLMAYENTQLVLSDRERRCVRVFIVTLILCNTIMQYEITINREPPKSIFII